MKHKVTSFRQYRAEQDAHDTAIQSAAKVDVPKGLSKRLLDIPHEASKVRPRHNLSWAAGVVLMVFGFVAYQSDLGRETEFEPDNFIPLAMDHIANQNGFLDGIDEQVSLAQVNMKLAPFGSRFEQLPGRVYYVNHCNFGPETVFQMIVGTEQGKRVNVYLVPKQSEGKKIYDQGFVGGVQTPYQSQSLVVISDDTSVSKNISEQVTKAMRWEVI
ncbi:DUF3379 domain-containing protein [Photobacterium sanctipauli]|uniref:DUF3379 domain-containing protein n=1 Tax=Photobacterium sanctipauli TaxID=1342794 RepID=A0A2T3P0Q6_9GAMM|nr:DUF3379 family protein [Photobacterium sanctipauli]PSW22104.1 DUF3379 domain-containing protein [Photobacterium sanctipauli]